jgi:hypothetical protein
LSFISDIYGRHIAESSPGKDSKPGELYIKYTIPDRAIGSTLISPNKAVVFFNYDTKFTVDNPAEFIYADESQILDKDDESFKKILATSCEKIDDKRYLVTFKDNLPTFGRILIRENADSLKGEIGPIAETKDNWGKLAETYVDSKGTRISTVPFENTWVYVSKTEYIEKNKARIYFSKNVKFESSKAEKNVLAYYRGT